MKIVFTVCSNNYLAQAITLGNSIKMINSEYLFFIGLTDNLSPEIDYSLEVGFTIIPSYEIEIPDFDNLWKKYSIVEFNTSVRPFYFHYFCSHFSDIEYLFYLDPDTLVFNNLNTIEREFGKEGRILLTPHITTPIDIGVEMPNENLFLIYGIFNLGFLGLKYPLLSYKLLDWWKERCYYLCFDEISRGLYVDQLWFNLVPVFFEQVKISKHPGLNMAPWNLHERKVANSNQVLYEDTQFPLVFYHFSDFKYSDPDILSWLYPRFNFETREDLKYIYQDYYKLLLSNGIQKFSKIKSYYTLLREHYLIEEENKKIKSSRLRIIKNYLKKNLPNTIIKITNSLRY